MRRNRCQAATRRGNAKYRDRTGCSSTQQLGTACLDNRQTIIPAVDMASHRRYSIRSASLGTHLRNPQMHREQHDKVVAGCTLNSPAHAVYHTANILRDRTKSSPPHGTQSSQQPHRSALSTLNGLIPATLNRRYDVHQRSGQAGNVDFTTCPGRFNALHTKREESSPVTAQTVKIVGFSHLQPRSTTSYALSSGVTTRLQRSKLVDGLSVARPCRPAALPHPALSGDSSVLLFYP